MALIAFASAKGSPGVSVTVAGLAALWSRRAIVADLDPIGSDVALRYRSENGDPLDTGRGLVSLGAAVRAGGVAQLEDHLQRTAGGMETLVGVASPSQVQGLGAAWQHIGTTLRRMQNVDVLADCGRLTPGSPAMPIVEQADAVVMVTGPSLESVAHLRERLRGLHSVLRLGSIDAVPVGVALVSKASDRRGIDDLDRLLASAGLPVQALGVIADDAKTADVIRMETGRNIRRSVLVRSLTDLATRAQDLAGKTGRVPQPHTN